MIIKKLFIPIILMLASSSALRALTPEQEQTKAELLSAYKSAASDSLQMQLLHRLALLHQDTPEFLYYEGEVLKKAEATGNLDMQAMALYAHLVHYYNSRDKANTRQWAKRLIQFCEQHQKPDYYFPAQRVLIEHYINNLQAELATIESQKMLTAALEQGNTDGIRDAYISLSNCYAATMRYTEELNALEQALATIDSTTGSAARIEVYSHAVVTYCRRHKNDQMHHCATLLEESSKALPDTTSTTAANIRILLHSVKALHQVRMGNPEAAELHLQLAEATECDNLFYSYKLVQLRAYTEYYEHIHNYEKAAAAVDQMAELADELQLEDAYRYHLQKANLLVLMNRPAEAIDLYKATDRAKDSIYTAFATSQIEQLQQLYDVEQLQQQTVARKKQTQAIFLVIISLIGMVLIIYNLRMMLIRRRLRRQEEELRQLVAVAKKANESKGDFLSNMSYSIRIPLNNVVGFSQLMALDHNLTDEERQTYSAIVQHDSNKLIELVSDVLDLSRLEANMTKWQLTDVNLDTWCSELPPLMEVRSQGSVRLELEKKLSDITLHIDGGRFTRYVLYLLLPPTPCDKPIDVRFIFMHLPGKHLLVGRIEHSPMANPDFASQQMSVRQDICRRFFQYFGGSLKLQPAKGRKPPMATFTLPVGSPARKAGQAQGTPQK